MRPVIDPISPLRSDPRGRILDRIATASVFLCALGTRLYYLGQLRETPLFSQLDLDPAYYVAWGRRIAAGDWLSGGEVFEQSPLYAYILAGIFRLGGEGLMAPRLVQAVVGSLTCLLVFFIGRRLLGRSAGLAAGMLAALYAPAIFYDGMIMKTCWAVFLAAAFTAALVASEGSRRSLLFAAGLLLGLAALVRDNLILLAPLLAAWLAVDVRVRGRMTSGWAAESLARVAFFAAGILLAVAPVTARNFAVSGEAVLLTSGGGEVFYIGNNPAADGRYAPPPFVRATSGLEHEDFRDEAERRLGRPLSRREASGYWLGQGLEWISAHPGEWAVLLGRKLLILLNAYELPDNQNFDHHRLFVPALQGLPTWALLLPLAAAGLLLTAHGWRDHLPLWVIACGYVATVLLFFNFARFRMPLVPVLMVFAGGALAALPSLLRSPRSPSRIALASGAALAAAVAALLPLPLDALHRGQSESQLAGWMLRSGRAEEARAISERGMDLLGSVYDAAGGKWREARRVSRPGEEGRPPLGDSFFTVLMDACVTRSAIERALGGSDGALDWSARAAAAAPDSIMGRDALTAHAEALVEAGRSAEALDPILRARRADPAAFRPALVHAQILHRTGRPREAIRIVEGALGTELEVRPLDLADANFGLALAWRDLGDTARMRFHLREALRLNPSHPAAGRIREWLAASDAAEGLAAPPQP